VTTLAAVRRILAVILLVGMTGTFAELLLLKHDEDAWQLIPLVLLGAGVAAVGWRMLTGSAASALVLRLLMVLFLAAGAAGIYLHYAANVEFQRETDPALAGRALLWSVLQAKVPPALAPGVMVQLALVGLAYTYRHKEH
jgi:tetrahydromethanopterin S-methyltransferase subunit E